MSQLTLADVGPILGWQIDDGSEFLWKCYGPAARFLDFQDDGDEPSWQVTLVFDTTTTRVLEVSAYREDDLKPWQPWRWIDPEYRSAHLEECEDRSISPNTAWDDVLYNEIEDTSTVLSILENTIRP